MTGFLKSAAITETHSVWTVTGYINTKRDYAPTVCIWYYANII